MMKDKYKVLIISCWATLIFYAIIKLFGGDCFELMTTSNNFIKVTTYIDQHVWLKKTVACVPTILLGYFTLCAILKEKYLKWYYTLIFILLAIIKSLVQWDFKIIGYLLDIICLIIFPILINTKMKWSSRVLRPIFGNMFILLFQVLSMFLSNIALFKFNATGTLEALLYSLEIYFCVILYYLYANSRKEV